MNNIKENKLNTILLCISPFFILFANNGSFTVRSIFILIIIAFLVFLLKKEKIYVINKSQKILAFLMLELLFSTVFNCIRHETVISFEIALDYLYFISIFIWFYCMTSNDYSKSSINKILICYNIVSLIMSFQIISMSLSGIHGKIMITNFAGVLMDENYVTAIISMTPIYSLISLLEDKKNFICKVFDIFLIFICSLAIALAGSRAALIGLFFGFCFTLFEYLKNHISLKKMFVLIIIFIVGFIFIINLKNIMPTWIYNRYFHSNYMDNSNTTRILIWNNAIEGIKKQPVFGYGVGVFSNLSEFRYTAGKSSPAHQTILDFGLYGGIIGIVLFALFISSLIFQIVKNYKNKIYFGLIVCLIFISMIFSATRSMFLWNNIIYLSILFNYNSKTK